ncbi:MAG: BON domain-containing protein [Bacteriovoracaceae bacterium]
MNEVRYSRDRNTEEDKEFFDKYSPTGESEWSRGSTTPFDNDVVLSERHYQLGSTSYDRRSQFSRTIKKDFTGVGPVNYKRSDERIFEDCSDALYRAPDVDASDIEVSVKDGIVTLKGYVESRVQKKVAEMVLEGLPGVMDINNLVVIENPKPTGLMVDDFPVA